ncbi:helix-turn-helix domain-containing protein [Streptomyces sp. SBT349]|uniref:helix-turn-helix domain-containing protein n=1 Tax=Streptomyces sp. SBT349 TaxID=1580539 RepID=UPI00066E05C1|nr:helix-turn-helix transcriptional regulator [Streptomyces sp. SBT349]
MALRIVAAALRRRREATGLTMAAVAHELDVHPMTISRIESATRGITPADVTALMRLYGADAYDIDLMLADLAAANAPGWWHQYRDILTGRQEELIRLEAAASVIRGYAPALVPDLLQTPAYTRALLSLQYPGDSKHTRARREALHAARKRHAFDRPKPLRLWVLLEEAALHHSVGSSTTMRDQLDHLAEFIACPPSWVKIQVMPLQAPPHALLTTGTMEIFRLEHSELPDHLVVRGLLHASAHVTDNRPVVERHIHALNRAAIMAPLTETPLPSTLTLAHEATKD